ncbi:MAG: hypothetical protein ACLP1Y_11365 [Candidatus Acidiferrales bacterium]
MGDLGEDRRFGRTRTVTDDWLARLPSEPGRLYGATLDDLEDSYLIQSVTLNQAFVLCAEGRFEIARQCALTFGQLFDRLAQHLQGALCAMEEHGRHFGTLPNVHPLDPANFRSQAAQTVARLDNILGTRLFTARSRFFHKLSALGDALAEVQRESQLIAQECEDRDERSLEAICRLLEVLDYDLNTCMQETVIVLKSFFCALPVEELASFREKLLKRMPSLAALRC